jgi:hypothetical protein
MSKLAQEQESTIDDIFNEEITEDDYGFIVGPDGELKAVFLPESAPFKTNKKIQRVCRIFGITDPEQLTNQTLH